MPPGREAPVDTAIATGTVVAVLAPAVRRCAPSRNRTHDRTRRRQRTRSLINHPGVTGVVVSGSLGQADGHGGRDPPPTITRGHRRAPSRPRPGAALDGARSRRTSWPGPQPRPAGAAGAARPGPAAGVGRRQSRPGRGTVVAAARRPQRAGPTRGARAPVSGPRRRLAAINAPKPGPQRVQHAPAPRRPRRAETRFG